ncbi:MarR family transcriptional regulator [Kocuria coralli]|uniref:MarR family transcriptional regulator n=1 Tax=Kocuria coralli TaxID=1461025 RepID=A0A5J5KZE0_9MICC|nr:MarR family transcriptional regulator [Kocuria coralli]KAA9394768.1 MarR family transcriptional regulator [Kocuria coralli]
MTDRVERFSAAIRTIGFAERAVADEWVRQSGLTRQQAFTIGYIEEHQDRGVIAREISEMSGTTPASVASLIQGLEDRGLITRTPSPEDSRVKLLAVTDEGVRLTEGFDDAVRQAQAQVLASLSDEEQEQLVALLDRVVASIDTGSALQYRRRRRDT